MIWRVGKVENIDMGSGFIPSPGFTVQQDGRSPALTIIFEDLKTAEQCASSMREIIDKATAIRGRLKALSRRCVQDGPETAPTSLLSGMSAAERGADQHGKGAAYLIKPLFCTPRRGAR